MSLRELDPAWGRAWAAVDLELREWLVGRGLQGPNVWTGLPLKDDETFMEGLWAMLKAFGWPWEPADSVLRLGLLRGLFRAARGTAAEHGARLLKITPARASYDRDVMVKTDRQEKVAADRRRAAALQLQLLPSAWVCRRFRRRASARTEDERRSADEELRLKWADQVAGLVMEAKLPFAQALEGREADRVVRHRCCRGLRAGTLRKRPTDWRPVRRFLLSKCGKPFPTEVGELLNYL